MCKVLQCKVLQPVTRIKNNILKQKNVVILYICLPSVYYSLLNYYITKDKGVTMLEMTISFMAYGVLAGAALKWLVFKKQTFKPFEPKI